MRIKAHVLQYITSRLHATYDIRLHATHGIKIFMQHMAARLHAMLLQRGKQFAETSTRARHTIAELGAGFVHHDAVVMVHGFSRVALALLQQVADHVSITTTYDSLLTGLLYKATPCLPACEYYRCVLFDGSRPNIQGYSMVASK